MTCSACSRSTRIEGDVGHDRRAIVLSGPPGAGKSRILNEVIGAPGSDHRSQWLEIDPDEIKKLLLDAAAQDGSYETFFKPPAVREVEAQGGGGREVPPSTSLPSSTRSPQKYLIALVEVWLGNAYGVSWAARDTYESLLRWRPGTQLLP